MSAAQEPGESSYPLLVTGADVLDHLDRVGLLERIGGRDDAAVAEVTAGNMNRVFVARGVAGGVAVKQAPPWVQVVGPEWPIDPERILAEARAYSRLSELGPDVVPEILHLDAERHTLVMEDLSDLTVLRDLVVGQLRELVAGRAPAPLDLVSVAESTGRFVGVLSSSTTREALGAAAHDDLIAESANPDLCALTLDVVLDEPYREHEHNSWRPAIADRVTALYADDEVHAAVAAIRAVFETRHEALLHGDLHSGSVMAGVRDGATITKVFDPEFSFVGPIGMDLGLFWANLAIAAEAARAVGGPVAEKLAGEREAAIDVSWNAFLDSWSGSGDSADRIRDDAWRFAGVEAFRRVAGFSHAADIETLPDASADTATARVFDRARGWLVDGRDPLH